MKKVEKQRFKQLEKQAWAFDTQTKLGLLFVIGMIIGIIILNV